MVRKLSGQLVGIRFWLRAMRQREKSFYFFVVSPSPSGLPQKAHPKTMLLRMGLILATTGVSMPLPSPRRLMDQDNPWPTTEYKKKCAEIRDIENMQREPLVSWAPNPAIIDFYPRASLSLRRPDLGQSNHPEIVF